MSDIIVPEQQLPRRSRGVATWLVLSQLVLLFSLLPWFFLAASAAGELEAGRDVEAWAVAGPVFAYPLLLLLSLVIAWRAWSRRRSVAAVVWSLLPLLVAVPLITYILGMPMPSR